MRRIRNVGGIVCLVAVLFHSFVLVPKAHATSWELAAARQVFMAVPPSVIAGAAGGTALVLAIAFGIGVDLIVFKGSAISALKTWLNDTGTNILAAPTTVAAPGWFNVPGNNGWTFRVQEQGGLYNLQGLKAGNQGYPTDTLGAWFTIGMSQTWSWITSTIAGHGGAQPEALPTSTVDYQAKLAVSQPSFPAGSVYASPGAAARIASGARDYGITVSWMSDSAVGALLDTFNGKEISSSGTEAGTTNPTANDNTLDAGASQQIGLLTEARNYLWNLLGIKSDTSALVQSGKDQVAALQDISAKLDNQVSPFPASAQMALDNIAGGIEAQGVINEQTRDAVLGLDNAISGSPVADMATVQSRLDALKIAASTKFPFSLATSITVAEVQGSSSYEFTALPLTPGISVPINPMAGPMASFFTWVRQMIVWFFWVGTLFAILAKGMSM